MFTGSFVKLSAKGAEARLEHPVAPLSNLHFASMRVSAGVEVRFHLPIFPVPLRLIYGVPLRELDGDQTSNFTFSIGRSF